MKEVLRVKKIILYILIFVFLMTLMACDKKENEIESTTYTINLYHMNTFINVRLNLNSDEEKDHYEQIIDDIFSMYHLLSTGYEPLAEDSPYKTNIYAINLNPKHDFEIDFELYEILEKAKAYYDLTWGYFDISIGHIVDTWKNVILDEENGFLFSEISEEAFQATLNTIEDIEIIEDPFDLWEDQGKYYVRLNGEHVKLDLGAISKGFATQKVADLLIEDEVQYFSISTGSSSIVLGENINRLEENGIFYIGLANPLRVPGNYEEKATYGVLYVNNTSVTTSGNYEQFATYEGYRYHHIVSPKTKIPMQYYHTVSVIGNDASLLDAISTALFSMSPEVFETWIEQNQAALNIEIVRYNQDSTITTYLIDTEFQDRR
jgi:FAD:protein FMN transferase